MKLSTILMVEDDPLITMELSGYLDSMNYIVLDVAYNAPITFEILKEHRPDAVLLDMGLGLFIGQIKSVQVR